jgi:hypothetical protein
MLLPFTANASGQSPAEFRSALHVVVTGGATIMTTATENDVLARMMSFDRDGDGRVEKSEVPERMHGLVTRGDVSGDERLDTSEIHALLTATTTSSAVTDRGFTGSPGYMFGDQVSLSSRSHIEGALEDLRLASPAREEAAAIVKNFVDGVELDARAELMKEMWTLLTTGQRTNFENAVDRQLSTPTFKIMTVPNEVQSRIATARLFMSGMDLGRRIEQFGLPPADTGRALAAVERFKTRLRLGDGDRSELLRQLNGVLTDEERDNFRAALERRPLVKAPGMIAGVGGVVGGFRRAGPNVPAPR